MRSSLLTCFILFSQVVFSQEIPPDLLKKMEQSGQQKLLDDSLKRYELTAGKGNISFTNGETARFKSIILERDSVLYEQTDKIRYKIPLSAVTLVTETHRHRGYNALMGGAIGLVSGLLVGLLAYPEENTLTTIVELLFQVEDSDGPELSKKAIPLIVGATAAGALIGTIVITKKDQEVIYKKKDITVSLVPGISATPDVPPGYMLTARIRF
jgi:hypothetical protein